MKEHYDPWYVRLPDGRIMKAKSTTSVRHHVEAGNIPLNSMARRDNAEEWVSLVWIAEFADFGEGGKKRLLSLPEMDLPAVNGSQEDPKSKSGVSARLDPMRLQTVGIRGLVDELIAAFDSTVSGGKILIACTACAAGSLAIFLLIRLLFVISADLMWVAQIVAGAAGLFVLASITALLTRQTHEEISSMRPVSAIEALRDLGPFLFRVFLGYLSTIGVAVGLLVLLHHVPGWLPKVTSIGWSVAEILQTAYWVVGLTIAVVLFLLMLLSFLVPPILVVEQCTLGDALREWRAILREHRIRVVIYEGMAIALAVVAALPLALPIQLAQSYGPTLAVVYPNWLTVVVPVVFHAVAIGPALAFLAVANLFIYLNLRYEYSPKK